MTGQQVSISLSQIKMKKNSDEVTHTILSKIRNQDIVHKVFLKPIQIALKTRAVQLNQDTELLEADHVQHTQQKQIQIGALPQGLVLAVRSGEFSGNKYETQSILPLKRATQYKDMKTTNTDNMISFLKGKKFDKVSDQQMKPFQMEVAICVCMYSEGKVMLKDTLKGIQDNFSKMVNRGVDPDSIGVFVILDGIEKVHSSVIDLIQEFERDSEIYLGQNNLQALTTQDIEKELRQVKQRQQDNEGAIDEVFLEKSRNNFLFSPPDLDDREERRFKSVHSRYMDYKKMTKQLQKLRSEFKSTKMIFQKLPTYVQKNIFIPLARAHKWTHLTKQEVVKYIKPQQLTDQLIIDEYAYSPTLSKMISFNAINYALRQFQQFFSTRQKLAYLGSFRKKVYIQNQQQKPENQNEKSNQILLQEKTEEESYRHMNLFMCIKYKNSGKLTSHNWFFNGFCKQLNPKYSILLDVGLKPFPDSLLKMYTYMKHNDNVGGVCGYMSLKIEKVDDEDQIKDQDADWLSRMVLTFVDIQKAQQMEYHLAHILDKPFESLFNFIHVLPGAFSGYNMEALRSKESKDKLLKHYFKSIDQKLSQGNIKQSEITLSRAIFRVLFPQFLYQFFFGVDPDSEEQMLYNQNIYLAEDRILCMQIHKNGKDLVFLPDAYAQVDPIKTVHGLMGQRKRWINGSYFAFEKVKNQKREFQKQNGGCEFLLTLQIIYLNFVNVLGYFAPSLFFFTLHISMVAFKTDVLTEIIKPLLNQKSNLNLLNFFVYTIDLFYAMMLGTVLFFSLNTTSNKPIYKPYIYFISTILGLMSITMFIVLLVDMIRGLATNTEFLLQNNFALNQVPGSDVILKVYRYVIVGVFGMYMVPVAFYSLLYRNFQPLFQIIKASVSFIFYSPSYFVLLNIYSLCRIDDISWGTKGLQSGNSRQSKLQDKWKMIKLIHVTKFVVWNVAASVVLLSFAQVAIPRFFITLVLMALIVITLFLKVFLGLLYLLSYSLKKCCSKTDNIQSPKQSTLKAVIATVEKGVLKQIEDRLKNMHTEMEKQGRNKNCMFEYSKIIKKTDFLRAENKKFEEENKGRSYVHRTSAIVKKPAKIFNKGNNNPV